MQGAGFVPISRTPWKRLPEERIGRYHNLPLPQASPVDPRLPVKTLLVPL
jgi:hypothetical protein